MRAIRRTGAGALVGGVVMLGVVTGGSPAAAEPIEHDHFHDVSSEVIEGFCDDPDLTVRFDLDVRGMFLLNAHGPDGLAYGMEHVHGTSSATNLANDRTFTEVFTFANKDLTVTDNGDGTLTIVGTSSGSHRVIGPDGELLFMEAGRMMVQFMVYTNGTPTDPTDDDEVAGSFTVLRSFTGHNDLEGRDYCDDVHEFIG